MAARKRAHRKGTRRSSRKLAPEARPLGQKHRYRCPLCGGVDKLDATWKADVSGHGRWFVDCFTASCSALGGAYLTEVASAVGAPSGAAILDDPLRWFAHLVGGQRARGNARGAEPLPSHAQLA